MGVLNWPWQRRFPAGLEANRPGQVCHGFGDGSERHVTGAIRTLAELTAARYLAVEALETWADVFRLSTDRTSTLAADP